MKKCPKCGNNANTPKGRAIRSLDLYFCSDWCYFIWTAGRLEALSKHIAKMNEDTWRRVTAGYTEDEFLALHTAEEDAAIIKQLRDLGE